MPIRNFGYVLTIVSEVVRNRISLSRFVAQSVRRLCLHAGPSGPRLSHVLGVALEVSESGDRLAKVIYFTVIRKTDVVVNTAI
jgi:hypothetical protein